MTGDYLEQPGPNATPDNPVLVSVQILPFPDKATASSVMTELGNGTSAYWSMALWCPLTGVGHQPCASSLAKARRAQDLRLDHRYLIDTQAIRTDLTSDTVIDPWLTSAADQAADTSGPETTRAITDRGDHW